MVPASPALPSMSLTARLANIFAAPGEVFDELKTSPPRSVNWIVPLAAAIVVGITYGMLVFSQPGVLQNMREINEKKFQKMVEAGKLTQQQADQMLATTEKLMSPGFWKVIWILGSVFGKPGALFLIALIVWLLGRFALHGTFDYLQAVEITGLSTMITVLGGIIALLLAVIYGNMSMTPGPVLLIRHFDATNKLHLLLSALNVFSLWYIAVLSLGLARLSGTSFCKSALWLYGIWMVLALGPLLIFGGR